MKCDTAKVRTTECRHEGDDKAIASVTDWLNGEGVTIEVTDGDGKSSRCMSLSLTESQLLRAALAAHSVEGGLS